MKLEEERGAAGKDEGWKGRVETMLCVWRLRLCVGMYVLFIRLGR